MSDDDLKQALGAMTPAPAPAYDAVLAHRPRARRLRAAPAIGAATALAVLALAAPLLFTAPAPQAAPSYAVLLPDYTGALAPDRTRSGSISDFLPPEQRGLTHELLDPPGRAYGLGALADRPGERPAAE